MIGPMIWVSGPNSFGWYGQVRYNSFEVSMRVFKQIIQRVKKETESLNRVIHVVILLIKKVVFGLIVFQFILVVYLTNIELYYFVP